MGDATATSGRSRRLQLVAGFKDCEVAIRKLQAQQLVVLAEMETATIAADLGYANTTALLMHTVNITRNEADKRIARAIDLHPTTSLTGAPIDAQCPHTARALAEGRMDVEQIDVIRDTVDSLKDLAPEQVDEAERFLVDKAQELEAKALGNAARRIRDHLDQDGKPPKEEPEKQKPVQYLNRWHDSTGRLHFKGYLDAEMGARLDALLSPLERRRTGEAEPDTRTWGERAGDALADIVMMASNCPDLPLHNGVKAEVTMTINYERTLEETRNAALIGDEYVSPAEARRVACDAHVVPVVLGTNSEPLDVAEPAYVVPARMRRMLVLRDRGCTHPGCARPAAACHSHHVDPWLSGGKTELSNLALVCNIHHRLVHHSDWEIEIRDGRVYWIPPSYVDPERRPRFNGIHRRL